MASHSLSLLVDPDNFEESLCAGSITVALDEAGRLRHVWQAGSIRDGVTVLRRCIAIARRRYLEQSKLLPL